MTLYIPIHDRWPPCHHWIFYLCEPREEEKHKIVDVPAVHDDQLEVASLPARELTCYVLPWAATEHNWGYLGPSTRTPPSSQHKQRPGRMRGKNGNYRLDELFSFKMFQFSNIQSTIHKQRIRLSGGPPYYHTAFRLGESEYNAGDTIN